MILSFLFTFTIFFLVDKIYFEEISNLIDISEFGYMNSLVVYEKRTFLFILLSGISILFSMIIYGLYRLREKKYIRSLEGIREKIIRISEGNYEITPEEVEQLGSVFDEFSKLMIELREKSELANADKLKIKEALEDISHQMKTPIASMEILLELEKSNPGNYLEKIEGEIERINALITNLLVLAKLDINQIEFQRKEVSAKDI